MAVNDSIAELAGQVTTEQMSYAGGVNYERAAHVAYGIFVLTMIAVVLYFLLRPGTPDPSNDKAFGCYTTADAAPILLDQRGMTIFQAERLQVKYHLELHKTGIALTAEAPIAAELSGNRYIFLIKPPGVGRFLDFFDVIDGHSYGVFDEKKLSQFTMLTEDVRDLSYRKSPADACRI